MISKEERRIDTAKDLMTRYDIKWCNKYPKERFYIFDKNKGKYIENKILLEDEILCMWPASKIADRSAILSFIAARVKVDDIKELNKEDE